MVNLYDTVQSKKYKYRETTAQSLTCNLGMQVK